MVFEKINLTIRFLAIEDGDSVKPSVERSGTLGQAIHNGF